MALREKEIKILRVAERLFAEKGFNGTSVRTIAREAGVNVAMISYYFGNKKNLLKELSFFRVSDFREELETLLNAQTDPLETVDTLIIFLVGRLHRNRRIHRIINLEYTKNLQQVDFDYFTQQKQKNYKIIEDFITKGQNRGVFSKSVNTHLIMPTIMGIYFNIYYNKKTFEAIHGLENITMDELLKTHLIPHIQRTIKALLTYEE